MRAKRMTKPRVGKTLHLFEKAIRQYYKKKGFTVRFPSVNIPVGNAQIDGEAVRSGFKIAIELKGPADKDIVKGIGQLVEAHVHGYQQAFLVVTEKRGQTIRKEIFEKTGIGLATVSKSDTLHFLVEALDLNF